MGFSTTINLLSLHHDDFSYGFYRERLVALMQVSNFVIVATPSSGCVGGFTPLGMDPGVFEQPVFFVVFVTYR